MKCRICKKRIRKPLIKLPKLPVTGIYGKYMRVNQEFYVCPNCGHGQLGKAVDPKMLYGEGYHFRTSTSYSGRMSAINFVKFVRDRLIGPFNTILEIGCSDLYVLRRLEDKATSLIGVDPSLPATHYAKVSAIAERYEDYYPMSKADIVLCKDVLEHIDKPMEFMEKAISSGHDGTRYFFQFPLFEYIVKDRRYDQVFHRHINYFSWKSINKMMAQLGCVILACTEDTQHWGAVIIEFKKGAGSNPYHNEIPVKSIAEGYKVFKEHMKGISKRITSDMYAYGASLMLPLLNYHLDGKLWKLKGIIDDNHEKSKLRYGGLPVPIVNYSPKGKDILLTAIASKYNVKVMLERLKCAKSILNPLEGL